MTKRVVYVTYQGYDKELDNLITEALEEAGLEWYASGSDMISGERELCFDYEKEVGDDRESDCTE